MQKLLYPTSPVYLQAAASAVGGEEWRGPLGPRFDFHDPTDRFGADTWEKAEAALTSTALNLLCNKAHLHTEDIDLLLAGDLQNQCVASSQGLCAFGAPYVGLYGACSTAGEGLLLGTLALCASPALGKVVSLTSSHNCAAERQFRLPLEYGGQRSPTAQWTATAAGAFLLGREEEGVRVMSLLPGCMVDSGTSDAMNMGAAMAPAAAHSIASFLLLSRTSPADYDCILTGDLGREGSDILAVLLARRGIDLAGRHRDCGMLLYDYEKQDVHSGGSGCGCSAAVLAAEVFPAMLSGKLRRVLFLATGALMSPSSLQQGGSITGIAPAVCLEVNG